MIPAKVFNSLKHLILFTLIFIHSWDAFAQYEGDLKSFREADNIEEKTAFGIKLWSSLMRNELDTLRKVAFELIFEGVEEKNDLAVAVGKRSLGTVLIRSGEQDKGIYFLKQSLKYFRDNGDIVLATETLNEIGNGYLNKGVPLQSEKYYLKSLEMGKNSPDPTSKFLAEINLGQAYIGLKNFDKASGILQHYKNESLKHGKLESVANAYALLGTIEQQKRNIPLAMEYFRKSAEFGKKSKSLSQQAHALNNMAIVYFEEGDMQKTLQLFIEALEIRKKTGNSRYVAESYYNIGGLYFEMGDYAQAEKYYLMSLELARSKKLRKDEMDALQGLTELYKTQKKQDKVVQLLEEYIALQEAYYSQLSSDNSYSNELMESISELEQENKMEEKDLKMKQIESSEQRSWYLIYGIGGLTLLVLSTLLIFRKRVS